MTKAANFTSPIAAASTSSTHLSSTISSSHLYAQADSNRPPFSHPVSDVLVSPRMSTVQPTVWLGCQNGDLLIYSSLGLSSLPLDKICLNQLITQIW
ncbi:unnamed protein product [Protopolystoma xenopodis]|uniref:Uncharacterized protein n=1 Tax=Protopolystoma xenopodis TaxID=117903 RepID=A0A448W9Y2_9PLAT|nr:unnamed protein product [Protopolystoma xenopodis]